MIGKYLHKKCVHNCPSYENLGLSRLPAVLQKRLMLRAETQTNDSMKKGESLLIQKSLYPVWLLFQLS